MSGIKTIFFDQDEYPLFQTTGFSARFSFPFAKEVCKGEGLDIGCNRPEWALPGAVQIDPLITPEYNAMNLPHRKNGWDYIYSSHCLEHLDRWVEVLDYWHLQLADGGVLFLYLPDASTQKYWRPWNNRKHVSFLTPEILQLYLKSKFRKSFVSGVDFNNSFSCMAEK